MEILPTFVLLSLTCATLSQATDSNHLELQPEIPPTTPQITMSTLLDELMLGETIIHDGVWRYEVPAFTQRRDIRYDYDTPIQHPEQPILATAYSIERDLQGLGTIQYGILGAYVCPYTVMDYPPFFLVKNASANQRALNLEQAGNFEELMVVLEREIEPEELIQRIEEALAQGDSVAAERRLNRLTGGMGINTTQTANLRIRLNDLINSQNVAPLYNELVYESNSLADIIPHVISGSIVCLDFDDTILRRDDNSGQHVLVESEFPSIIQQIRAAGADIFILTARSFDSEDIVLDRLARTGVVNLDYHSLALEGGSLNNNPRVGFSGSAIYCGSMGSDNANNKGEVLEAFLTKYNLHPTRVILADDSIDQVTAFYTHMTNVGYSTVALEYVPGNNMLRDEGKEMVKMQLSDLGVTLPEAITRGYLTEDLAHQCGFTDDEINGRTQPGNNQDPWTILGMTKQDYDAMMNF